MRPWVLLFTLRPFHEAKSNKAPCAVYVLDVKCVWCDFRRYFHPPAQCGEHTHQAGVCRNVAHSPPPPNLVTAEVQVNYRSDRKQSAAKVCTVHSSVPQCSALQLGECSRTRCKRKQKNNSLANPRAASCKMSTLVICTRICGICSAYCAAGVASSTLCV